MKSIKIPIQWTWVNVNTVLPGNGYVAAIKGNMPILFNTNSYIRSAQYYGVGTALNNMPVFPYVLAGQWTVSTNKSEFTIRLINMGAETIDSTIQEGYSTTSLVAIAIGV